MENGILIDLTTKFIENIMTGRTYWRYYSFSCGFYINPRQLKNASRLYAPYDKEDEIPLVFVDSTILGNGKRGVLITNRTVYYRLLVTGKGYSTEGKKELKEIFSLYFQPRMSGSYLMINNQAVGVHTSFSQGSNMSEQATLLNNLLASFLEAIKTSQGY